MNSIITLFHSIKWKLLLAMCAISTVFGFFLTKGGMINARHLPPIATKVYANYAGNDITTVTYDLVNNRSSVNYAVRTKLSLDNRQTTVISTKDSNLKTAMPRNILGSIRARDEEQSIRNVVKDLNKQTKQTLFNISIDELSLNGSKYKKTEVEKKDNEITDTKIILFWTKWFSVDWSNRFGDYQHLREQKCPSWKCEFTYDRNVLPKADAVIFIANYADQASRIHRSNPSQRWVVVDVESPLNSQFSNPIGIYTHNLFNWTMTYHSNADIVAFYGHFLPVNYTQRPLRPNLMDYGSETMKSYLRSLQNGDPLQKYLGDEWTSFVRRPKLAAWMSGHCPTNSKRETYIKQLQKYAKIDTYGTCGTHKCRKRNPYESWCWVNVLAPNYLFYFSMENSLCEDYITEKLYNPLLYGLVPVVYGGANYSNFLPPHSYIDALQYDPKDLAKLLLEIQEDPVLYGRYHLWRHFWEVKMLGNLCELCHRLHVDKAPKTYNNVRKWRNKHGKCFKPRTISDVLNMKNKRL